MFWFIYKKLVGDHFLYNWELEYLKYTLNQEDARKFYDRNANYTPFFYSKTIEEKRYEIPVIDDVTWLADANQDFRHYIVENIKNQKIGDDYIRSLLAEFVLEFDAFSDGRNVFFKKKDKRDDEIDQSMVLMKLFIAWVNRFHPIKVKEWSKWHKQVVLWETIKWLEYTYRGAKYETDLHWTYISRFIKAMFEDSVVKIYNEMLFEQLIKEWWSEKDARQQSREYLDYMQKDVLWNYWRENFIDSNRGSGKSFIISFLCIIFLLAENYDGTKPRSVLYYGQTEQQLNWVIGYLETFLEKFQQPYLVFNKSALELTFFEPWVNWKPVTKWVLRLVSASSRNKGLGSRPDYYIIDEAKEVDEKIYKITNAWKKERAIWFYVTTVDYETDKNWFYEGKVENEFKQLGNEKTEDIVFSIWKKYELDKKDEERCRKNPDVMMQIRQEYLKRKWDTSLSYTIYQNKFRVQSMWGVDATKDMMKEQEAKFWIAYVMWENFWVFVDEKQQIDIRGCIDDVPDRFDIVVLALDIWGSADTKDADYAAISICWKANNKIFVIDSMRVKRSISTKPVELAQLTKNLIDKCKWKYGNVVRFAFDATNNNGFRWIFELMWVDIDFPIDRHWNGKGKETHEILREFQRKGKLDLNRHQLKKYLLEAINSFFITFNKDIRETEGSHLFEEIKYFDMWLRKYHDDQVCAMMMAVFILYVLYDSRESMLNESIKMNKWVDPTDADAMRMRLIQKLKNEDKQKEREKPRLSIRM